MARNVNESLATSPSTIHVLVQVSDLSLKMKLVKGVSEWVSQLQLSGRSDETILSFRPLLS